jgi:hypothetical protein
MTRKDFKALAAALAASKPYAAGNGMRIWLLVRGNIADVCMRDNANFDLDRFYEATNGDTV